MYQALNYKISIHTHPYIKSCVCWVSSPHWFDTNRRWGKMARRHAGQMRRSRWVLMASNVQVDACTHCTRCTVRIMPKHFLSNVHTNTVFSWPRWSEHWNQWTGNLWWLQPSLRLNIPWLGAGEFVKVVVAQVKRSVSKITDTILLLPQSNHPCGRPWWCWSLRCDWWSGETNSP